MDNASMQRTVKGAFHIHSTYSGDGELELSRIKDLYFSDGYNFLAINEHQHDMDQFKFGRLVDECERLSEREFLLIPGIEFNCYRNHILGIGIQAYPESVKGDEVIDSIKDSGGFSVWAHPRKNRFSLPDHLIRELDGIEIWNSKFDGKYAPQSEVIRYCTEKRNQTPRLRAVCSVDLHFRTQFRDLAMYCEVNQLTRNSIIESLHEGKYYGSTGSVRVDSTGTVSTSVGGLHLLNQSNLWLFQKCKALYANLKKHHIVIPTPLKVLARRLFS